MMLPGEHNHYWVNRYDCSAIPYLDISALTAALFSRQCQTHQLSQLDTDARPQTGRITRFLGAILCLVGMTSDMGRYTSSFYLSVETDADHGLWSIPL